MPEENNEQTSGGLDIASQSGQQDIADSIQLAQRDIATAIGEVFRNVNIYLHDTKIEESEENAATSEQNAADSEQNAADSATLAQSYAVGGTNTRTGEDTDNAAYYYSQISSYVTRDAVNVTLPANGWDSTTHLITVNVPYVTADTNNEILLLPATSQANIDNNDALRDCDLYDAGQGNGTITLYAKNIPVVDLTVRVIVHA